MDDNKNQYPANNDNQQPIHRPIVINPSVTNPENSSQVEQLQTPQPTQFAALAAASQTELKQPQPNISQVQNGYDTQTYLEPVPSTQGFYKTGDQDIQGDDYDYPQTQERPISWSAPEFVMHEKSPNWFMGLIVISILIGAGIYLLTRDFLSVAVIVLALIIIGKYSLRQPKMINYTMDDHGVNIGDRNFRYDQFKHFSAVAEGDLISINFSPMKRFSLPVGACCTMGDEEDMVLDYLSDRLPIEEYRPDVFDNLIQRLHL
jgi:hypothetical protein